jgi:hypothetical protein
MCPFPARSQAAFRCRRVDASRTVKRPDDSDSNGQITEVDERIL